MRCEEEYREGKGRREGEGKRKKTWEESMKLDWGCLSDSSRMLVYVKSLDPLLFERLIDPCLLLLFAFRVVIKYLIGLD